MQRGVLSICLILLLWCGLARADNNCWMGADYTSTASGGHEDSKVIWGTSGALGSGNLPVRFCQAAVANNSASAVWVMIFDSATLPSNGTKNKMEWPVASGGSAGWFGYGSLMVAGVVIACSSTEGTLTVTTSSACNFHITISK